MKRFIQPFSFILTLLLLLPSCGETLSRNEPVPVSLEIGYRRMFSHSRGEYVYTPFEEAVQKSGSITLARLKNIEDTGEGYAIYTFEVTRSLYNPDNDTEIHLYEDIPQMPDKNAGQTAAAGELSDSSSESLAGNILTDDSSQAANTSAPGSSPTAEPQPFLPAYRHDVTYLLVLSRATDVYYPHPYFHNYNGIHIFASDNGSIKEATSADSRENLKKSPDIRSHFHKIDAAAAYVQSLIDASDNTQQGLYSYISREILSENPTEITQLSPYIALAKANRTVFQNRYIKEVEVTIITPYKGIFGQGSSAETSKGTAPITEILPGNRKFTVLFPAEFTIVPGEKWLLFLYEDAEYRITSRNSVIPFTDKRYATYLDAVKTMTAVPPTLEPETPTPTPPPKVFTLLDEYAPLVEKNADVRGWFQLPDTVIDYPVLQAKDNDWYLSHNIDKQKTVSGSIVLDFRVDIKNLGHNTPVYGHNMKRGTMFHELVNYKSEKYFKEHPTILFNTLYEKLTWEVIAVYVVDSSYNYVITMDFEDTEEYQLFLDDIKKRSMVPTPPDLSTEDKIITLVTCSYEFDGARTVIQARLKK